jgi:hypothetical protein
MIKLLLQLPLMPLANVRGAEQHWHLPKQQ